MASAAAAHLQRIEELSGHINRLEAELASKVRQVHQLSQLVKELNKQLREAQQQTRLAQVRFGLIFGRYIIFDLLGRSSEISLLDKNPYLAVEVVDTHFHSKDTFRILLELTGNLPVIVCYYYASKAPIINNKSNPTRAGSYARVRLQHYLADGSFWIRNERAEETYNVSLENYDIYYNFIVETLYTQGFLRNEA